MEPIETYRRKKLPVFEFFDEMNEELTLSQVNSDCGFDNCITDWDLHRPGLALAGFFDTFSFNRAQIFGNTEIHYLSKQPSETVYKILKEYTKYDIPCIIVSNNNPLPYGLKDLCLENKIALFISSQPTTEITHHLWKYLYGVFAAYTNIHATLVDVFSIGILLTGEPGTGKSEIALDLVERGHRLIADDMVHIRKQSDQLLMGYPRPGYLDFLEVRGLGIVNVRKMFGVHSTRPRKRVELELHLEFLDKNKNYERVGDASQKKGILDVEIPYYNVPIVPGKNITVIVESLALDTHLRVYGYNSGDDFNHRVLSQIDRNRDKTIKRYLDADEY